MLIILKNRTLLTEIEYYLEIRNIKKENKKLKVFQNIVTSFKINSIDFRVVFFLFLYVVFLGFVVVAY